MIRSHPPPQAGCPLGDPGPLSVLTQTLHAWVGEVVFYFLSPIYGALTMLFKSHALA